MPLGLRAVFGGSTRPFYLLEDVVVDVRKQSMEVGGFVANTCGLKGDFDDPDRCSDQFGRIDVAWPVLPSDPDTQRQP